MSSGFCRTPRRSWLLIACLITGFLAVGCASGTGKNSNTAPAGGTPVKGGIVTVALQPGWHPNWIWPFFGVANYSNSNIFYLQALQYRPLYWFGAGEQPILNQANSLARPPVFSDGNRSVTITLKSYKWSDGVPVTTRDMAFWINMSKAEKQNWAEYVPGDYPDNIVSYTISSPTRMTLHLNASYSPQWFLFDELSQITPMPPAWDRTASGSANCAAAVSDCAGVYAYLTSQAQKTSSYATSKLWGVVDGPWRLSEFSASGDIAFIPNKAYSGPVKPKISELREMPFTSEAAETNVLRYGTQSVQVGYLPPTSVPSPTRNPSAAGTNPLGPNFYLNPVVALSVNYFLINFNNPNVGMIFKQLYIRQALQHLIDQPGYIDHFYKGYAYPTYSPLPSLPKNDFGSPVASNPYPYSVARARALLQRHGWSIPSSGAAKCVRPGTGPSECGAGITKGKNLHFNFQNTNGDAPDTEMIEDFKSAASQAGIEISLSSATFDTILSVAIPCKPTQSDCGWQMENWGGGWAYQYYPDGGPLFGTGAGSNMGSYSDPDNDKNIQATHTEPGTTPMSKFAAYLSKSLPVIWLPQPDWSLTEIDHKLRGVIPQNLYGAITPEDWYYVR